MKITLNELRKRPHWSFSSLNELLNICSLQWFSQKVEKLTPTHTSVNLVAGSVYHRTLDQIYQARKLEMPLEKDDEGITIVATDGRRMRSDRFDLDAEPGLYDIKIDSARKVFLARCEEELVFPNYRQVVPANDKEHAYALQGIGKRFAIWATSALGCYLGPKLIELGEDEGVTLYIQKNAPDRSPALLQNETTTLVVMPIRMDSDWAREIGQIRIDMARKVIEQETAQQETIAA